MNKSEVMTTTEAAKYWGVSSAVAYKRIKRGDVKIIAKRGPDFPRGYLLDSDSVKSYQEKPAGNKSGKPRHHMGSPMEWRKK